MMDITRTIQEIAIFAIPLLLGLSLHEASHGYVANMLGDPTAKLQGRLTLNPLKHLDVLGTIVFFIARIGWAKPVPVNPNYFKNPRGGMALVALAGPASNFFMACLFAAGFHLIVSLPITGAETLAYKIAYPAVLICQAGVMINLILGVFNLLPVPPLDGSNIVAYILPAGLAYKYMSLGRYGMFIILGLFVLSRFFGISIVGHVLFPPLIAGMDLLGVPFPRF